MNRPTPSPAPVPEFEADLTKERFYRGTIVKLHEGSQRGVIRGASGRLIPFTFMFVTMSGPHRQFSQLRVGLEVGYDVGHTSHGLRVSTIRIPDEPPKSVEPDRAPTASPVEAVVASETDDGPISN